MLRHIEMTLLTGQQQEEKHLLLNLLQSPNGVSNGLSCQSLGVVGSILSQLSVFKEEEAVQQLQFNNWKSIHLGASSLNSLLLPLRPHLLGHSKTTQQLHDESQGGE